jgi:hypothetical protein
MRPIKYALATVGLLVLLFGALLSGVGAQRPGGATPGGRSGRATGTPRPTLSAGGAQATLTPRATGARSGQASITPPATLARGSATPQATAGRGKRGTPTVQAPASSADAETAVVSFASTHLGIAPDLLYAGSWDGDAQQASASATQTLNAIIAQLPQEAQAFVAGLSEFSGAAYWGVWKTGAGIVALADCTDNPNCTVTQDNLKLYITTSSGGVYGVYAAGSVANSTDALNLLKQTYPALASLNLTVVSDAQTGYAFQATTTSASGSQAAAKYVYAGVVTAKGQHLVYALVAVGEGYVQLAKGG